MGEQNVEGIQFGAGLNAQPVKAGADEIIRQLDRIAGKVRQPMSTTGLDQASAAAATLAGANMAAAASFDALTAAQRRAALVRPQSEADLRVYSNRVLASGLSVPMQTRPKGEFERVIRAQAQREREALQAILLQERLATERMFVRAAQDPLAQRQRILANIAQSSLPRTGPSQAALDAEVRQLGAGNVVHRYFGAGAPRGLRGHSSVFVPVSKGPFGATITQQAWFTQQVHKGFAAEIADAKKLAALRIIEENKLQRERVAALRVMRLSGGMGGIVTREMLASRPYATEFAQPKGRLYPSVWQRSIFPWLAPKLNIPFDAKNPQTLTNWKVGAREALSGMGIGRGAPGHATWGLFNSGLNFFEPQVLAVVDGLKKLIKSLLTVGTIMSGVVALAVFKATKAYTEFELRLREVQSLLNSVDPSNVSRLGDVALETAKKVNFGTQDVLKAYYDTTSAGFKVAESQEIIKHSANLAKGGLTDLAASTSATLSALRGYNLGVEHSKDVTDTFFQTVLVGRLTMTDLTKNIGDLIPTARAAGVSLQGLGSLLATATLGGLNADEATTGLRRALTELAAPSEKAREAMRAYGIQTTDSMGRLLNLYDVFKQFEGMSLAELERIIPEQRAAKVILTIANNVDQLSRALDEMSRRAGAAQTAADKIRESFSEMWKSVSIEANLGWIELGRIAQPVVKNVVGGLKELLTDLREWYTRNVENIQSLLWGIRGVWAEVYQTFGGMLGVFTKGVDTLDGMKAMVYGLRSAFTTVEVTLRTILAILLLITGPLYAMHQLWAGLMWMIAKAKGDSSWAEHLEENMKAANRLLAAQARIAFYQDAGAESTAKLTTQYKENTAATDALARATERLSRISYGTRVRRAPSDLASWKSGSNGGESVFEAAEQARGEYKRTQFEQTDAFVEIENARGQLESMQRQLDSARRIAATANQRFVDAAYRGDANPGQFLEWGRVAEGQAKQYEANIETLKERIVKEEKRLAEAKAKDAQYRAELTKWDQIESSERAALSKVDADRREREARGVVSMLNAMRGVSLSDFRLKQDQVSDAIRDTNAELEKEKDLQKELKEKIRDRFDVEKNTKELEQVEARIKARERELDVLRAQDRELNKIWHLYQAEKRLVDLRIDQQKELIDQQKEIVSEWKPKYNEALRNRERLEKELFDHQRDRYKKLRDIAWSWLEPADRERAMFAEAKRIISAMSGLMRGGQYEKAIEAGSEAENILTSVYQSKGRDIARYSQLRERARRPRLSFAERSEMRDLQRTERRGGLSDSLRQRLGELQYKTKRGLSESEAEELRQLSYTVPQTSKDLAATRKLMREYEQLVEEAYKKAQAVERAKETEAKRRVDAAKSLIAEAKRAVDTMLDELLAKLREFVQKAAEALGKLAPQVAGTVGSAASSAVDKSTSPTSVSPPVTVVSPTGEAITVSPVGDGVRTDAQTRYQAEQDQLAKGPLDFELRDPVTQDWRWIDGQPTSPSGPYGQDSTAVPQTIGESEQALRPNVTVNVSITGLRGLDEEAAQQFLTKVDMALHRGWLTVPQAAVQ